jgi:acetyl esterase/lipase
MTQVRGWRKLGKFVRFGLLFLLLLTGCLFQKTQSEQWTSLPDARRNFKTVLIPQNDWKEPVPKAPDEIFKTIKYSASSGDLAAYLSPNPGDGKRHPAIIWIVGGDCNSIGDVWSPAPRDNDQTAAVVRNSGIVMMFPSLRGGNNNPGIKEGFLGEVEDVLAAANYLAKQTYVDPKRIFLGGHSTGGTLALLVAESSDYFRAVFSFGPVAHISYYGEDSAFLPFDTSNRKEVELRSPIYWLSSIRSPTWVFEGTNDGNIDSLRAMAEATTNPKVNFIELKGMDHFNILAPVNEIIANKILQDTGEVSNIFFSKDEIDRVSKK